MTGRAAAAIRRTAWILAWAGLWGGLVLRLSPAPALHLPGASAISLRPFVDRETLIASRSIRQGGGDLLSGQLLVVHLPTGEVRQIPMPDETSEGGAANLLGDERLESAEGTSWRFQHCHVVGDSLAVTMSGNRDQVRLHLFDWRTGRETFRRDITGRSLYVLPPHLLLSSPRPEGPDGPLERLEIPSGRTVPTLFSSEFRAEDCHGSPDGTWLASSHDGELWVWRVDSVAEVLNVSDVDDAAFSSDSRWLATLSRGRVRRRPGTKLSEQTLTWRIYDIATGRMEAERVAVVPEVGTFQTAIAFHDENRSVVAYDGSAIMGVISVCPFSRVDRWRWREDGPESVSTVVRGSHDISSRYLGATTTPRHVCESGDVVDVATGERCSDEVVGLYPMRVSHNARWGVYESSRKDWRSQVAEIVVSVSKRVAAMIGGRNELWLLDLPRGRTLARVGEGHFRTDFSPENDWLAVSGDAGLEVWSLPPRLPIGRAFAWSLVVPFLFLLRTGGRVWTNGKTG